MRLGIVLCVCACMHFFSLVIFNYSGGEVDLARVGVFQGENSKESGAKKLRLCASVNVMTRI